MSDDERKKWLEKQSAECFLDAYNRHTGGSFRVVAQPLPPFPDVRCEDAHGQTLHLEITLLEDQGYDKTKGRKGDAAVIMGRSDERDWRKKLAEIERAKRGEISMLDTITTSGDIVANAARRIEAKLTRPHQGEHIALVLRSTSGVDWDWERYTPDLDRTLQEAMSRIGMASHHYSWGIWIVAAEEDANRIYPIDNAARERFGQPA